MTKRHKSKNKLSVIFVKEVKVPICVRKNDKVLRYKKSETFLCRDCNGFFWFETFGSLYVHYDFMTIRCGILATVDTKIKRCTREFILPTDISTFNVHVNDRIILYPSGACCVLRRSLDKKNIIFPIHLMGSEEIKEIS